MTSIQSIDGGVLPIPGGVLYNNTFGKGEIANYRQVVFRDEEAAGWEWEWPEIGGLAIKSYPEVIAGRSPWSEAAAGHLLPRPLAEAHLTLDFDFTTVANGRWCESFDFWITKSDRPNEADIVANLCVWTAKHGIDPVYRGVHETLTLDGRAYHAILETPSDNPAKPWKTLCLIDAEPRNSGSLGLEPLVDTVIEHGLAQPTDFLATAELGSEIAYGRGRTTLRTFSLRQASETI
jgi:hypothetical protein